jgi:periplasmic protein TonB
MKALGQVLPMPERDDITALVLGASKVPRRARWLVPVLAAIGVHVALVLSISREETGEHWALATSARVAALLAEREARPVELPPAPEPPKVEEPPRPEPAATAPTTKRIPGRSKAQAPAQAGQIVAAVPTANQPIDFGDAFVVGEGAVFAGGHTTSSGTAKHKVEGPVANQPAPAMPAEAKAPDLSKPLSLSDPDWTCPWPREADDMDIDQQIAIVKVQVSAEGRCESVAVVRDPGHGFGAQAARCAKEAAFAPALNVRGKPIAGTAAIRVRFVR